MRITFIVPDLGFGGGIKVVAIYALELVKFGHKVTLISPPPPKASAFERLTWRIKGERGGWPQITDVFPEARSLDYKLLDKQRPVVDSDVPDGDIVIATWWETAEWVNRLSTSKGAKVYLVQGHEVFPYLPVERCQATYRMPLHKIVVSHWLRDVMRESYGDDDIVVVPNSVDHSLFYPVNRTKQPVATVGILYSTVPTKGLAVSQAAIRLVQKNIPDVRVVYFGNQRPAKSTRFEAQDVFHFRPPQQKIREIYSACDVWLTASTSEGFNLTAMEAMACGTPIVSTRTGWPAESIVPYVNGVLTDVDDVPALASGLEWVLTRSQSQWADLSNATCKTVEASSWHQSAKLFEAALIDFAAKKSQLRAMA